MRTRECAAALAMLLVLAGCGSEEGAAMPAPAPTGLGVAADPTAAPSVAHEASETEVTPAPCDLLTPQEVTAAVDEAVGPPEPFEFETTDGLPVLACAWTPTDPSSGSGRYLVTIIDDRGWEDGRTIVDFVEEHRSQAETTTDLGDLGDEAFIDEAGIAMRTGHLGVYVNADERPADELLPFARAVLDALATP